MKVNSEFPFGPAGRVPQSRFWGRCAGSLGFVVFAFVLLVLFAPNFCWEEFTGETPFGADFLQEWVGAHMIVAGEGSQLYEVAEFQVRQHDASLLGFSWDERKFFPPVYPPPHYFLFSPLACLPYRWASLVWLFCLLSFAVLAVKTINLLCSIASKEGSGDGIQLKPTVEPTGISYSRLAPWIWPAVFLFPPVMFSLVLAQKSVLWLMILSWAALHLHRGNRFTAGLAFGFLSLKPTLFFLLPLVMLRNRNWSFIIGCATSTCVIWGMAWLALPIEVWSGFLNAAKRTGDYAAQGGYRLDWACNLFSLVESFPKDWILIGKISICGPLAIYTLYCAFTKHETNFGADHLFDVLVATLLLSPHAYHYDLAVLLLPIIWLAVSNPKRAITHYALLAMAFSATEFWATLAGFPIIPIVLVAFLCESRLSRVAAAAKIRLESIRLQFASLLPG